MRDSVFAKIYPKKTIDRVEAKIRLLGVNNHYNLFMLLNFRVLISLILFVLFLLISNIGYILAPIIAILFYYFSEMVLLDYPIKKRAKKLEKEALFFFEVLLLTLESGRNLGHALQLTTLNIDSELSSEFKKTLEEVKLGKSLNEALNDMKKRIPSEAINNALLNMVESNLFGNSILTSMNNQIDFLREKQMLDVKSEINKLPTKVSIISALFFVPIMLLIILAPVLLDYILG
ncbi:type II secretion system F domain protein [Mycoplasma sp. CAG:776]|nr:type II secretion system F domain protein [Mycoplasma sp. CAG:776]